MSCTWRAAGTWQEAATHSASSAPGEVWITSEGGLGLVVPPLGLLWVRFVGAEAGSSRG